MNKRKKGQISGQIFAYVTTIIIFSFILIYGYKALTDFREKEEHLSFIKFKKDITSAVERIAPEHSSVEREEFYLGGDYTQVCFLQNYQSPGNLDLLNHDMDKIVKDSYLANSTNNVFVYAGTFKEPFYIGRINTTEDGYLCIDAVKGKIKVELQGKGDHSLISRWG
ncbi:MAG TPA: hypothetical protein VFF28_01400 [Candidatus Nanoarchaeia archaeon]|nr:hypothetical protein [Candidatus Nanoarchaeia archaeon]